MKFFAALFLLIASASAFAPRAALPMVRARIAEPKTALMAAEIDGVEKDLTRPGLALGLGLPILVAPYSGWFLFPWIFLSVLSLANPVQNVYGNVDPHLNNVRFFSLYAHHRWFLKQNPLAPSVAWPSLAPLRPSGLFFSSRLSKRPSFEAGCVLGSVLLKFKNFFL